MGFEEGLYSACLHCRRHGCGRKHRYLQQRKTHSPSLFYNTRLELVVFLKSALESLGYHAVGPYLDKEKGTSTAKYGIMRRKDYWKLALARFEQAKGLFTILPIKHSEKVRRKGLAIGICLEIRGALSSPR